MKKIICSILVFCFFLTPVSASAIDLGSGSTKKVAEKAGYSGATTETTFSETVGTVVKAAMSLLGVIFTALMVYAGYLWMTARGEEDQVNKAKRLIQQSIIGLIIAVMAYSITDFVVKAALDRTAGNDSNVNINEDVNN